MLHGNIYPSDKVLMPGHCFQTDNLIACASWRCVTGHETDEDFSSTSASTREPAVRDERSGSWWR